MAILHMTFASESLKRWTECIVIIPMEKRGGAGRAIPEKFPTLYLLHGYTGNCMDWCTESKIRAYAEKNGIAVVMPSGENSFYLDDEQADIRYAGLIAELVTFTRRLFPLSDRREDTFLGGLSMGGFGALRNGFFYSHLFSRIIGLSGAYIQDSLADMTPEGNSVAPRGYYERVFGDLSAVLQSDKNPVVCARRAAERGDAPSVFLACGTEDSLLKENREMCETLRALGIHVDYFEGPGSHDWTFWDAWTEKAAAWLMDGRAAPGM